MNIRAMQILGFLQTVLGWIFIACSLAMEGWKVATTGGQGGSAVVIVGWYWSSLWRVCSTFSNNVSTCHDFPVLWSVEYNLQIVRGLLMSGLAIGKLGFILSMVGMECTYIGGKKKNKNRTVFAGGLCHITSGLLAAAGYIMYAWHVSAEYFNPSSELKFDLGTPLFLGWVGCLFQITGGLFYLVYFNKPWPGNNNSTQDSVISAEEGSAMHPNPTNRSTISDLTTRSRVSTVSDLSIKKSSSLSKISHETQCLSKPNTPQDQNSVR
ncbi:claudin-10 [Electrophorus electricus]|uniref:claudin-10 n=1 Tax=Electrophorus electricus TaxID=8005 RepID=UPI0015CFFB74|nr:claudin-10 [Electrophorus electricus]